MASSTLNEMLNAPESQIRAILRALCSDVAVKRRALEHYDALRIAACSEYSQKRKAAQELSICVQCDEPYTADENDKWACLYHWGELEVDYDGDFWADHDERCHGTIDTDAMRKECPDGFVWTCCDKLGSEEGCTYGKHEAHPDRSKRGRDSEPLESDDDDDDDDDDEEDEDEDEDEY